MHTKSTAEDVSTNTDETISLTDRTLGQFPCCTNAGVGEKFSSRKDNVQVLASSWICPCAVHHDVSDCRTWRSEERTVLAPSTIRISPAVHYPSFHYQNLTMHKPNCGNKRVAARPLTQLMDKQSPT